MAEPIWLSDDPAKALLEIAEFIDSMELTGHRYPDGADKRAFAGYWQPVIFFYSLQGIAHEARRVAGQSST